MIAVLFAVLFSVLSPNVPMNDYPNLDAAAFTAGFDYDYRIPGPPPTSQQVLDASPPGYVGVVRCQYIHVEPDGARVLIEFVAGANNEDQLSLLASGNSWLETKEG